MEDNYNLEILKSQAPELFIVVFSALDRVQHFHWGEPIIRSWYQKIDKILGALEKFAKKIIIISDHGFCGVGKARVKTLPKVNEKGEKLKGDHHQEAILITKNINCKTEKQDN